LRLLRQVAADDLLYEISVEDAAVDLRHTYTVLR
jgi:hypothetical protein